MEKFSWREIAGAEHHCRAQNKIHVEYWTMYGEYDPEIIEEPNPLEPYQGIFQLWSQPSHWLRPTTQLPVNPTLVLHDGKWIVTKSLLMMPRKQYCLLILSSFEMPHRNVELNDYQEGLDAFYEKLHTDLEFARDMIVSSEGKNQFIRYFPISMTKSATILNHTSLPSDKRILSGPETYCQTICSVVHYPHHKFDEKSRYGCELRFWENYVRHIGGLTVSFMNGSKDDFKFGEPRSKGYAIPAADLEYIQGVYNRLKSLIAHDICLQLVFDFLNLAWTLPKIQEKIKSQNMIY